MQQADNAIDALIGLISQAGQAFTLRDIQLGCPLSTLAQEMAAIDEGFRLRLAKIYDTWHGAIVDAVSSAQHRGTIKAEVKPQQVAMMVVATMEGCLSAGKISQDLEQLMCCGEGLVHYLYLIQQQ